ncbi:zf-TFIIB domain-containing protein [Kribbella sp. NPDC051587]|jgi:Zn-finger nucleic acid-binding protein|uniref:TFIIB-type zinc ribbon-containing protein n=1 Tax=unclassified Kribbella TaxID=2644121 RepID=UPI0036EB4EE1
METLTCPKCRGAMRTYERSGITVDQCGECRGIFLDRGELERLVDAEARFNAPPQEKRYEEKKRYDDDRKYEDQRRYDDRGYSGQHHKKKQKSFLENLFD